MLRISSSKSGVGFIFPCEGRQREILYIQVFRLTNQASSVITILPKHNPEAIFFISLVLPFFSTARSE